MSDRLAQLVASIERLPDAEVRAAVQELMTLVVDMHGEALSRVFELVARSDGAAATLRSIATDETLRPVLELHGLAPSAPATAPTTAPVTLLPTRDVARCELCGSPAGDEHPHVVDVERAGPASLACACRPCHLVLSASTDAGRWRAVTDDWRAVDTVELPDVPVGVAFVVVDAQRSRPVAYYPGPAGATESELDIAVDALPSLMPGTEALVVRDAEAWVVPVSEAYALVGELRSTWEGLTGGDAPAKVLDEFVERARARCRGNNSRNPGVIASAHADGRQR